jgi:UDP-N-acetylglucosamine--N-acetylmuramyl-(pentapeptide) pyrophosphoryl-undecaprenol N-acetylglucosamine transferase
MFHSAKTKTGSSVRQGREMRIMIAGGGTGGHVYPGIAIYKALKRSVDRVDVLFVGARSGVESKIFENLGLPHVLLAGRAVRGTSAISKLTSPVVFLMSLVLGMKQVLSFKPDVVIGTGGYASVALVAASILCGKKRVIQEQNSVPGLANRLLSRFAHLVLLSYQRSRTYFGSRVPCAVVGNPLRIKPDADRGAGLRFFGLTDGLPTVLVFGGSRGAHAINEAARTAAKRILSKRRVQFVFLTGESDFQEVAADLKDYESLVRVYPFLEEIHHAYAVADLAVSRAGASAVFELAAFGIPSIFVPYPHAADDHQRRNVSELLELGAASVMGDDTVDGKTLETMIVSLLDDGPGRKKMARRSRGWSTTDGDTAAAEKIVEIASSSKLTYCPTKMGVPWVSGARAW